MKKRFAALLAATAIVGVTTAFAANPFSDVTPNDWAYQAVSQLASAGVINGYPDGTFKGQNNITRYEMAQMVAKAMANQSRVDAEQQAMINRLADEFSAELDTLGVRVGKLEKQVGALTYTGDARIRYRNGASVNTSAWDYRVRMQFQNQVNKDTTVTARIGFTDQFGNADTDRTSTNNGFGLYNDGAHAYLDRAYATHKFGDNVSVEAGRTGLFIGQGLLYDEAFDGAKVNVNFAGRHNVKLLGAYGYPMAAGDNFSNYSLNRADKSIALFQVSGDIIKNANTAVNLNAFYLHRTKGTQFADTTSNDRVAAIGGSVWGVGLDAQIRKIWIGGEYTKGTGENDTLLANNGASKAWTAGIGYGKYSIGNAGSWDVKVQYVNESVNSPVINSTWVQPWNSDYKAWSATVDYALAKNVGLSVFYFFDGKTQSGENVDDFVRAQMVYKF